MNFWVDEREVKEIHEEIIVLVFLVLPLVLLSLVLLSWVLLWVGVLWSVDEDDFLNWEEKVDESQIWSFILLVSGHGIVLMVSGIVRVALGVCWVVLVVKNAEIPWTGVGAFVCVDLFTYWVACLTKNFWKLLGVSHDWKLSGTIVAPILLRDKRIAVGLGLHWDRVKKRWKLGWDGILWAFIFDV